MAQEQVAKPAPKERKRVSTIERPKAHQETEREANAKAKVNSEELAALVDEIDSLLEDESFAAAYIQRGGE